MKRIRIPRPALLLVLCLALFGAGSPSASPEPLASLNGGWTQLKHLKGLSVFHLYLPGAKTLSLRFCVSSASLYDASAPALDRLLFSLMPVAGAAFDRQSLDTIKDGGGIMISGQSGLDYSHLSIDATQHEAERAAAILSSLVQFPARDESLFQEIRTQIINELLWQDGQVYDALSRNLKKNILTNHPYGPFYALEAKNLSKIALADVLEHHRKIMTERNLFIVSCGPQTAREMEKIIWLNFPLAQNTANESALTGAPLPAFPASPTGENTLRLFPHKAAGIPYLKAEYPAPGPGHPEYPASLVMARVLSEMLMESVRTEQGLVYSVWAAAAARRRAGNGELVLYRCSDIQAGVSAMRETIRRLRDGKPDGRLANAASGAEQARAFEEAVQAAKNQITSALAAQNITPRDRSQGFAGWYAASGEMGGMDSLWEKVRAVRPEDVRALAKRNFANMYWGITYDPDTLEEPTLNWKLD